MRSYVGSWLFTIGVATIAVGVVVGTTGFCFGSATLEKLGTRFGMVGLLMAIIGGAAFVAPDVIHEIYG